MCLGVQQQFDQPGACHMAPSLVLLVVLMLTFTFYILYGLLHNLANIDFFLEFLFNII